MKKGFTLIELLAVIVILAIIALIAVPIVLNIINDSKESSLLRSAEFYLDAVEYTIADAFLYHGGLEDKEYPITKDGDICKIELDNQGNCPKTGNVSNTLKVEVNGDKPTGGSITINGGKISSVELILDEKTIVKNDDDELVYEEKVCKLVEGTDTNNDGVIDLGDIDQDGQADVGDLIDCGGQRFFVVENVSGKVNMLSEYNLTLSETATLQDTSGLDNGIVFAPGTSGYWTSGYSPAGNSEYLYVYDSKTNIYPYIEAYRDTLEGMGVNVKDAKLLSYEQVINLGCSLDTTPGSCASAPSWVRSTNYWLGSALNLYSVWYISKGTFSSMSFYLPPIMGIRQLITILASDLG